MITHHKDSSQVEFDIAVIASEEGSTGAGGKVNVVFANVDIDGKGKLSREDVSRVKGTGI